MKGLIALVGAGEYLSVMSEVDRHLLASVAGRGHAPRVICLATAAGQEGQESVGRWLSMGEQHFSALGAEVRALPIIDRASAEEPLYRAALEAADLIYFSGGDPAYLHATLQGTRAWAAAQQAWDGGAVYAGCSAGAMILARRLPNMRRAGLGTRPGFGTLAAEYIMPHFDHAGPWKFLVDVQRRALRDGQYMLGVDENTALVGRLGGAWQAMGEGRVHLLTRKDAHSYGRGEQVPLPES